MKKLIKIIAIALLGIVLLAIIFSTISYNNFWAEDPQIEVDSSYLEYYHETYQESRLAFKESAKILEQSFDSIEIGINLKTIKAIGLETPHDWVEAAVKVVE